MELLRQPLLVLSGLLIVSCSVLSPHRPAVTDEEIRRALIGKWYLDEEVRSDYQYFEFHRDGSCGYYSIHGDPHFASGLSNYGTWQVRSRGVIFDWHAVGPWDPPIPLEDGAIRHLDSERLEVHTPYGTFRQFFRKRVHKNPNQAM